MLYKESPVTVGLQVLIILLASVIIFMLYLERATTTNIRSAVDNIDIPPCPTIPPVPNAPTVI